MDTAGIRQSCFSCFKTNSFLFSHQIRSFQSSSAACVRLVPVGLDWCDSVTVCPNSSNSQTETTREGGMVHVKDDSGAGFLWYRLLNLIARMNLGTVCFCKPRMCLNFRFRFSISCFNNSVTVWKRSCFGLKYVVYLVFFAATMDGNCSNLLQICDYAVATKMAVTRRSK